MEGTLDGNILKQRTADGSQGRWDKIWWPSVTSASVLQRGRLKGGQEVWRKLV